MIPLFGPIGPEILVVLLLVVLLFGANKIPDLARAVGESMGAFKQGRQEIEEEVGEMKGDVKEAKEDVEEEIKMEENKTN
jgi:sec-independent protein translocase protein TatA